MKARRSSLCSHCAHEAANVARTECMDESFALKYDAVSTFLTSKRLSALRFGHRPIDAS